MKQTEILSKIYEINNHKSQNKVINTTNNEFLDDFFFPIDDIDNLDIIEKKITVYQSVRTYMVWVKVLDMYEIWISAIFLIHNYIFKFLTTF